jgi:predicted transcriptional regulator
MAILNAAREGACKTRLMYNVNMNLASFNRYLRELTGEGLIAKVNGSHGEITYRTTERGRSLLELLKKAEEFISL